MAFGITKKELTEWKEKVSNGEIAYLTHYWFDPRYPNIKTVTKVGCNDIEKLSNWCKQHGVNPKYIHYRDKYPHYDLIGVKQKEILQKEGWVEHLQRFKLI
ncbi:hypothetical protein [Chengkuizengella axinellae]|uniref:Uncharacterized protein n=1 Tax=Chengkuizengella axinellae TaxID=3064388 RepID=A0ABT9J1W1_9BACL|nr:hypothetical protein [Chengkuizengella sp. 2205SS18-9]MDP5274994.1 hypothetical protein [Chengkuizengella sp. 2205SS18-9]